MSLVGLLGFAAVVLTAMSLLHGYLWWRLVRGTTRPGRGRRRLTLLIVLLGLLPALAVILRRTLPLDVAAPLDWVAYSWLGVAFYAFLTLLALEPARAIGNLLLRRKERRTDVPQRALGIEDEQFAASGARRVPRSEDGAAQPSEGTPPGRGAVLEDGSVMVPRSFREGQLPHNRVREMAEKAAPGLYGGGPEGPVNDNTVIASPALRRMRVRDAEALYHSCLVA